MLYSLHELAYHSATPFRIGAQMARQFWSSPFNPAADTALARTAWASAELFESVTRRYGKPAWGLEVVTVDPAPGMQADVHLSGSPEELRAYAAKADGWNNPAVLRFDALEPPGGLGVLRQKVEVARVEADPRQRDRTGHRRAQARDEERELEVPDAESDMRAL